MKNDLKEIRKIKHITLDELSKATRIHPPKLNRIENDLIEPSEEEIEKICVALRLSAEKIIPSLKDTNFEVVTERGSFFDELYDYEKAVYSGREKWDEDFDRILKDLEGITFEKSKALNLNPDKSKVLLCLLLQLKDKMEAYNG